MRQLVLVATLAAALSFSGAFAQTATSPPPASPQKSDTATPKATAPKSGVAAKPRTAQSIECSRKADAQGLHGKARKSFRATCKKELMKKS